MIKPAFIHHIRAFFSDILFKIIPDIQIKTIKKEKKTNKLVVLLQLLLRKDLLIFSILHLFCSVRIEITFPISPLKQSDGEHLQNPCLWIKHGLGHFGTFKMGKTCCISGITGRLPCCFGKALRSNNCSFPAFVSRNVVFWSC